MGDVEEDRFVENERGLESKRGSVDEKVESILPEPAKAKAEMDVAYGVLTEVVVPAGRGGTIAFAKIFANDKRPEPASDGAKSVADAETGVEGKETAVKVMIVSGRGDGSDISRGGAKEHKRGCACVHRQNPQNLVGPGQGEAPGEAWQHPTARVASPSLTVVSIGLDNDEDLK
jgi:hypothetical protein